MCEELVYDGPNVLAIDLDNQLWPADARCTCHGRDELQRSHAYGHVRVVQRLHDLLLILGNEMRVGRRDLHHG